MEVVAVVGLGYVGLSLAVAFGARQRTVGVDLSLRKVASYQRGHDPAGEVSAAQSAAILPTPQPASTTSGVPAPTGRAARCSATREETVR